MVQTLAAAIAQVALVNSRTLWQVVGGSAQGYRQYINHCPHQLCYCNQCLRICASGHKQEEEQLMAVGKATVAAHIAAVLGNSSVAQCRLCWRQLSGDCSTGWACCQ